MPSANGILQEVLDAVDVRQPESGRLRPVVHRKYELRCRPVNEIERLAAVVCVDTAYRDKSYVRIPEELKILFSKKVIK